MMPINQRTAIRPGVVVTVDEGGFTLKGVPTAISITHEVSSESTLDLEFGEVHVDGVRAGAARFENPEEESEPEGISVTPHQLRDGDTVNVYYSVSGPVTFILDDEDDRLLEEWQSAPHRRKFYLVEPAGEKVEDWVTLNEGDVVTVIQYFHSPPNGGTKISRDATVQDAVEREVEFIGAPGEPDSTALKADGDKIYLTSKADPGPQLGPDAPWILVEGTKLDPLMDESFVAMWDKWSSAYLPVLSDHPATPDSLRPSEIGTWAELEEPTFTLKGAA